MLKKGYIVKLTCKGKYRESPSNPLWGGQYGKTKGKVIGKYEQSYFRNRCRYQVKWDNGIKNSYVEGDLEIIRNINCDKIIVI